MRPEARSNCRSESNSGRIARSTSPGDSAVAPALSAGTSWSARRRVRPRSSERIRASPGAATQSRTKPRSGVRTPCHSVPASLVDHRSAERTVSSPRLVSGSSSDCRPAAAGSAAPPGVPLAGATPSTARAAATASRRAASAAEAAVASRRSVPWVTVNSRGRRRCAVRRVCGALSGVALLACATRTTRVSCSAWSLVARHCRAPAGGRGPWRGLCSVPGCELRSGEAQHVARRSSSRSAFQCCEKSVRRPAALQPRPAQLHSSMKAFLLTETARPEVRSDAAGSRASTPTASRSSVDFMAEPAARSSAVRSRRQRCNAASQHRSNDATPTGGSAPFRPTGVSAAPPASTAAARLESTAHKAAAAQPMRPRHRSPADCQSTPRGKLEPSAVRPCPHAAPRNKAGLRAAPRPPPPTRPGRRVSSCRCPRRRASGGTAAARRGAARRSTAPLAACAAPPPPQRQPGSRLNGATGPLWAWARPARPHAGGREAARRPRARCPPARRWRPPRRARRHRRSTPTARSQPGRMLGRPRAPPAVPRSVAPGCGLGGPAQPRRLTRARQGRRLPAGAATGEAGRSHRTACRARPQQRASHVWLAAMGRAQLRSRRRRGRATGRAHRPRRRAAAAGAGPEGTVGSREPRPRSRPAAAAPPPAQPAGVPALALQSAGSRVAPRVACRPAGARWWRRR
eukprot:scaffold6392_cov118-Isochrysis_galbana.AAC.12